MRKDNLKKNILLISVILLLLGVAGCGSVQGTDNQEKNTSISQEQKKVSDSTEDNEEKSSVSEKESATDDDQGLQIELKEGEETHIE